MGVVKTLAMTSLMRDWLGGSVSWSSWPRKARLYSEYGTGESAGELEGEMEGEADGERNGGVKWAGLCGGGREVGDGDLEKRDLMEGGDLGDFGEAGGVASSCILREKRG